MNVRGLGDNLLRITMAHLTILRESKTDSKNQGKACVRGFHRRAFADFMQRLPEHAQSSG